MYGQHSSQDKTHPSFLMPVSLHHILFTDGKDCQEHFGSGMTSRHWHWLAEKQSCLGARWMKSVKSKRSHFMPSQEICGWRMFKTHILRAAKILIYWKFMITNHGDPDTLV